MDGVSMKKVKMLLNIHSEQFFHPIMCCNLYKCGRKQNIQGSYKSKKHQPRVSSTIFFKCAWDLIYHQQNRDDRTFFFL